MWFNPKFPRPEQPSAPVDTGHRLATFSRGNGAELRVSLAEYEGRPYVSVRVWTRGDDGQFWPVKGRGCSIRLHEIEDMIAALRSVEDLVAAKDSEQGPPIKPYDGNAGTHDDRPKYVPKRGRPQPRSFNGEDISAPQSGGSDFNECDQESR